MEVDDTALSSLLIVPGDCEYATADELELSLRPRETSQGRLSFELWTGRESPVPRRADLRIADDDGNILGIGFRSNYRRA